MKIETRLADSPFDPADELNTFSASAPGAGAIASFTGIARPETKEGGAVERLFLDHHPHLTARSLDEVAAAAAERYAVSAVRIVHRCGTLRPGEPIVFVAAAARHRRDAFHAVDEMMDRLKTDAVFWKREEGVDGSRWIEPSDRDRSDRARWSETCPE